MARTIGIGIQNFEDLIRNDYFYIDKTNFIKEWWESGDSVTLITRPRRFGKTLNEKKYAAELIAEGISPEHIRKYGFAFKGKEVLIG